MRSSDPHPGAANRALPDLPNEVMVREEPLVIAVGEQRVLTMRTPGDDENLAAGFLLSEGVIDNVATIVAMTVTPGERETLRADTISVELAREADLDSGRLTRTHEIRSSCGVCGLVDADELLEQTPPLLPGVPRRTRQEIEQLRIAFEANQGLFRATGACHGAEIFAPDGSSWGRGEDVGRHNALDKAIGAAARAGHDLAQGTALLSGRAGYDLVFKCLRMRISTILSMSAASALSFDMCAAAGATLVGFVRADGMKVYCDSGRLS